MKKFVYIKAMSLSQSDIIHKMKGRRDKVAEHLSKCAMYGDALGLNKYNHWIRELATWISDINEIVSKPKGKKLKAKQYSENLFGLLGDERADSRSALVDLQLYNSRKSNPYPEIEIDDAMIERMLLITEDMHGKVVPLLSVRNNFNRNDIESLLHNILDPICKDIDIWS